VGVGPPFSFRALAPERAEMPSGAAAARWLADCARADRERWVLWLPVALGIGIALYFTLPSEPSSLLGIAFGISGLLLAATAIGTETAVLRRALACIAALLIGFSLAKHRT